MRACGSSAQAVRQALHVAGIPRAGAALFAVGIAGIALATPAAQADEPVSAFELSSLLPENGGDGTDGFVLNGIDADDGSGSLVSDAGDVNGDGIDDLIIAAWLADPDGRSLAGEAYVVFGGTSVGVGGSMELSSLDGVNGFVLPGIDAGDYAGTAVDGAGDVNGDGIDDLIIGAMGADPNGHPYAGECYVIFGSTGIGAGGSFSLSSLDGTNGFVLNGISVFDWTGDVASGAGDVNGDGFEDLIIGVYAADPNGETFAGASYVVFGGASVGAGGSMNLSSLDGTNGFVLNGVDTRDFSGSAVSAAGDVNGDGIDDVMIGAVGVDPGGQRDAGASYVVFGGASVGAGGSLELSSLDGTNGFVLNGFDAYDDAGRSVSGAGDVNGDGIDDVIIGARYADYVFPRDAGLSYVLFGGATVGAGGIVSPGSFNGTLGFILSGIDAYDESGESVSGAGDVDGDGIDDLIVGAGEADPGDRTDAGQSYVVFGGAGVGADGHVNFSSLDGVNGYVLNGVDAFDAQTGISVSGAGDVNADGLGDLVIGVKGTEFPGRDNVGASYVVFGRPPHDTDADGVPDRADNCQQTANADQRDTNEDGFGNLCDADLNDDCYVNFVDLGLIKSVFFGTDADADFDGNGVVNFVDLSMMSSNFFHPPGPSGLPAQCDS